MPGMRLTAHGKVLLAKALLGEELKFSKVAYGSGDFDYNIEKVSELTELKQWRLDLPIVGKQILGDGTVEIQARLTNFDVEEGFPAKEIGVYALDPVTGEELLYAYRNAGDEYNFIPAKTGIIQKDTIFCYRVEIQDAANVTCIVDFNFAYASQEDLAAHVESSTPHPNIPNHEGDVESADYFWTTDFDNHLHKISTDNAKKILAADISGKVDTFLEENRDLVNYRQFKRQGLDVNYIAAENLDDLSVEVTSCVQGGDIMTLEKAVPVGEYVISDGATFEEVKIVGLVKSGGAVRAKLQTGLTNDYNQSDTRLYRSYAADSLARTVKKTFPLFAGNDAGLEQILTLPISPANFADFNLSGDFLLTADQHFTMRN